MKNLHDYILEAWSESILNIINRGAVTVDQNTQLFVFKSQQQFLKWWQEFNKTYKHTASTPEYQTNGAVAVFTKDQSKIGLVMSAQET